MSIAMTDCARRLAMSTELIMRLKDLKLYGMAQCWPEQLAKTRHGELRCRTADGGTDLAPKLPSATCARWPTS
jgi:hypothetical protein